ncbi:MAG: ribonuclease PH [Alphaproteobacteria bacterium]|nr:ribonuclease PH [Alphaproteobacteria bacterium]
MPTQRPSKRKENELRSLKITIDSDAHAEGAVWIEMGGTKVYCTASVDEKVPRFLRNSGNGWVTAEYGMLPRATHTRVDREAKMGQQKSRTQEIQRLIARSLRGAVELEELGERQIIVDCDVIRADGGTRCASITGGFVALYLACRWLVNNHKLRSLPIKDFVVAVSAGIYKDTPILDLDYKEDSNAHVDANFVMTGDGNIIEVQGTGEDRAFSKEEFNALLALAEEGAKLLLKEQKRVLLNL